MSKISNDSDHAKIGSEGNTLVNVSDATGTKLPSKIIGRSEDLPRDESVLRRVDIVSPPATNFFL